VIRFLCRLGRLQDSNAVLSHFNDFSERSFAAVANDFSQNTRLLKSMKGDLDYVFRKIGYIHFTATQSFSFYSRFLLFLASFAIPKVFGLSLSVAVMVHF